MDCKPRPETSMSLSAPEHNWLRSFTAVPLQPEIRKSLIECSNKLQSLPLRAAWTPPERLHITLTFHGELPAEWITKLIPWLEQMVAAKNPFRVSIRGIGVFGRPFSPRVLWAGIEQGREQLVDLQRNVAEAALTAGIELEKRPYHPHITLGRIRRAVSPGDRRELQKLLQDFEHREFGSQPVHCITLMHSELASQGVRHAMLRTFNLANPPAAPGTT